MKMMYPSIRKSLASYSAQVMCSRGVRGRRVQRTSTIEQSPPPPPLFSAFKSILDERKLAQNTTLGAFRYPNPDGVQDKLVHEITASNMHDIVSNNITPLANLRYSEQLIEKEKRAKAVLRTLRKELQTVRLPALHRQMACPLDPIESSPVLTSYRSKDEFVVNRGVDGNPKTVGFLTGHPGSKTTVCVPPTNLLHIKATHKAVAHLFENFIRQSPHDACLHFKNSPGVWRNITVRSNEQEELMVLVVMHPHTLTMNQKLEIEESLVDYLIEGPGSDLNIRSLFLQECQHTYCPRSVAPFKLLHGEPHIIDRCQGMQIALAPDTYFPINVPSADILFSKIKEIGDITPKTTVLNVSSGHSTVSVLLAGAARGCVGVESSEAAVEEAQENGRRNDVTNCQYIVGPPELVLRRLRPTLAGCADLLAVLQGGAALHPKVVAAVREAAGIQRVLVLSSKPSDQWAGRVAALGCREPYRPRQAPTAPLLPHRAVAVDGGPHTNALDMALVLLREQRK